jgi:deoxycytidine triphosphate deaminase
MILSDKDIREYIHGKNVPLVCPFSDEQLQGASYDVSLSDHITVMKRMEQPIDPAKDVDTTAMYESKHITEEGYLFMPGEYLLAELRETISLPSNLIAHIRPRTRFTRSGILVADQHCNPTYTGVLQLGLFNAGLNPFLLTPGLKLAQVVFEELKSIPSEEKLYQNKPNAAYHQEREFRGSKFGEAGWSSEAKQLYQDVLTSLQEE